MFVSKAKYNNIRAELIKVRYEVIELRLDKSSVYNKYNALIDRINLLGGKEFLEKAKIVDTESIGFTDKELKDLLMLCHPDKHNNASLAQAVTQKINALRGK